MSKLFPIQSESYRHEDGRVKETGRLLIPWSVAETAYEEYSRRYGKGQSLERLAERGGFGRDELLDLLNRTGAQ